MKKFYSILIVTIMMLIPMGMMGQTRATVTDHMTSTNLAATGSSYTNFSNVSLESDAVYAGNSAREYANSQYNIQLRSNNSNSGIVTTTSGGTITSITITVAHGTNTIDVYGKNTAYSAASDLYNSNTQGTKIGSLSSTGTINVTDGYAYVGIRSKSGAIYLSSVDFVWEEDNGSTVATTTTIDASNITNTDVYVSTAAGSLTASVTETESGNAISGATVTWSSSDTDVATIDNNGTVTLVAVGTTTITASYAGESGVYGLSSDTYELTVTSSEPYVQPTEIEITPNYTFWGFSGQFSGTTNQNLSGSKENVSLNWNGGTGNTYANSSAMRFYANNTLTFTAPTGYEIKSIVITFTTAQEDLSFSPGSYSLSGTTGTWTGSSETVTMSRPSNASSYAQISKFTITLAAQGSAVATTTTITAPANFNTDIYQGTSAGTLTATVKDNENNTISSATVTWSSSNTGVATIDANGAVTLVAVGTTTITASYAGVEDEYRPSEGTYELTVTDSNAPGTENNPYTVAQAIDNTPSSGSTDNVYIHGIVSAFFGTGDDILDDNNHRYYISDDGNTTTQLLVYNGKGLNNMAFSNVNDLLVGDEVTVYGKLKMYQSAPEIDGNNYIVSLVRPGVQEYNLTVNPYTNLEIYIFAGEQTMDEAGTIQVNNGTTVGISVGATSGYYLTSLIVNGTDRLSELDETGYLEFEMPEEDVTISATAAEATKYDLAITGLNHASIGGFLEGMGSDIVTLTNNQAQLHEQTYIEVYELSVNNGYILTSLTLTYGSTVETVTTNSGGLYAFTMPSSNATLAFTIIEAPTYTLANSIESGKSYIIVGFNDDNAYAMGEQGTNNRTAVGVTVDGTTATGNANVHEVVITSIDNNMFTIEDGGYLYAASSDKNYLRTDQALDNNGKWTIEIGNDGEASIIAQGANTRNNMRFNINSNNNNPLFSCYASTSELPEVYLYVKDETPVTETYTLTINGYGNGNGNWNLIAWPSAADPAEVEGMITDNNTGDDNSQRTYDLYYFDETGGDNGKEWKNYRQNSFSLARDKGYLYANKNGVTFTFDETNIPFEDVILPYVENNSIQSLYLAGNSNTAAETFYVYNEELEKQTVNFLTINENGNGFITTSTNEFEAQALQGFFVQSNGEDRLLSTDNVVTKSRSVESLNIKASCNSGSLLDNAIVSFSNAPKMNKLYLNSNNTRVYIPQNGEEMAVVRAEAQGEMPVSFKASENGSYTISVNANEVEMNYLHLIDNLTGADTDLLATPSYTFNARTDDYASRFRLVFSAKGNNGAEADNFAFVSNGNIVLTEQGNAQVYDVMGRMISSYNNVNHITTEGMAAGVYVLQLVNGNNVKTQKIVVK